MKEKFGYFAVATPCQIVFADDYEFFNEEPYTELDLYRNGNIVANMYLFDVIKVGIEVEKYEQERF